MSSSKIQADYRQGTGSYDKSLGSLEAVQRQLWGAIGIQVPTPYPFQRAATPQRAQQQASEDFTSAQEQTGQAGSDKAISETWGKGVEEFRALVAELKEGINRFVAAAGKPSKLDIAVTGAEVSSVDMWA
jgi:hypothetical protein